MFDHVLGCFTPQVPAAARADLAERLADLVNAPPNVTRTLAFDEDIVVAQPILSRSSQLSDQDLVEIAVTRGSQHMTAICERRHVSELVTDILITHGDDKVWRAIAANAGARFSPLGKSELLDRSRGDEALQDILGSRDDLTDQDMQRLVAIAREAAKARLAISLEPPKTRPAAPCPAPAPAGLDYARAQKALRAMSEKRPVSEADIVAFARKDQAAEAIAVISLLAVLPIPTVERVFRERDDEMLLVIGKANNWSWRTVRALVGMRDPLLPEPSARPLEPTFDAISASAARRALQALAHADHGAGLRAVRNALRPDGT
nr:DUF2336 domain-containing protein [Enterovirga sp. DB1703]